MKLVIGLGNPGEKYRINRHNAGFMAVEYLERIGLPEGIVAKKTDTFMNDSGQAVSRLKNFYKISLGDLYIVHDDLDIPLGQYKIQLGVGPKVHNGLISIEGVLGDPNFWRVRIGVENRRVPQVPQVPKVPRVPQGGEYVLQDFTEEEKKVVEGVIKSAGKDLIANVT